jgi:hypothetical protein
MHASNRFYEEKFTHSWHRHCRSKSSDIEART